MQLPAASDTLSVRTIAETLFYSKTLLGATALISFFPSGIHAKRKVKSLREATK